jgi:hypothetical protein
LKRIYIISAFLFAVLINVQSFRLVNALGGVTVTGHVSAGQVANANLSACFYIIDNATGGCFAADPNGYYIATLDSSNRYYATVSGNEGNLRFMSSEVRVDYPQDGGVLDMSMATQVLTSGVLKDQFGNIISDSPININDSNNQPTTPNNITFASTGLTAGQDSINHNYAYAETSGLTDVSGKITFLVPASMDYDVFAHGPSGTNYDTQGAFGSGYVKAPDYVGTPITLAYPDWNTSIYGQNGKLLNNIYANGPALMQWAAYPNGADHYGVYRKGQNGNTSKYVGDLGELVGQSLTNSYNEQQTLVDGTYSYSLVAYDAVGNVLAVHLNASYLNLDTVRPVVGTVTMSKTTINGKTGPVTITLPTTDNIAISTGEYYIDTDPGRGSGLPMSMGADGVSMVATNSSLASISKGNHVLYSRSVDKAGNWSLVSSIQFSIK